MIVGLQRREYRLQPNKPFVTEAFTFRELREFVQMLEGAGMLS